MITGTVTTSREAIIPLVLRDHAGEDHRLEAIVDTGFNGALTLPPPIIAALSLPPRGHDFATLADGSETLFDFYEALVHWDGSLRTVVALAADGVPLVGMALMEDYEVTIQARPGGAVTITAL
jgi:clan AA aspartic protease